MNRVRREPPQALTAYGLVGRSTAIQAIWEWFEIACRCRDPLLILGETGTGKKSLAAALAACDTQRQVEEVNFVCASESEQASLLQRWRSYTQTATATNGELTQTPTLILHEIQAASLATQHQLASLMAPGLSWNGAKKPFLASRVIATSSANLIDLVAQGLFSKKLYWRLNVLPIVLPPLRRRPEDIPAMVEWITECWRSQGEPTVNGIDESALNAMSRYSWPGNGHELTNCLRAAALMGAGRTLTLIDLPPAIQDQSSSAAVTAALGATSSAGLAREFVRHSLGQSGEDNNNLYQTVVQPIERELIEQVLQSCDHKQVRAAERLGISRNTLHKKIKEFGLQP